MAGFRENKNPSASAVGVSKGEIAMLVSAMRRVKTLVTIVPEDASAE